MKKYTPFFRYLFFAWSAILMPAVVSAKEPANTLSNLPGLRMMAVMDTSIKKQPVKPEKTKEGEKPEIKEVPKSKRQLKPAAVKSRMKIKTPVKRIKPVIKRPLGLIRKTLGR